MVNEIDYSTIAYVIEVRTLLFGRRRRRYCFSHDRSFAFRFVSQSWEQLKRTKNYEEVAGAILFQALFSKCPQAKPLFGFPIGMP